MTRCFSLSYLTVNYSFHYFLTFYTQNNESIKKIISSWSLRSKISQKSSRELRAQHGQNVDKEAWRAQKTRISSYSAPCSKLKLRFNVSLNKIDKYNHSRPSSHMFSVFCASHSRLHWPVALRWRASLSSSICSRSFFQRRYSALSRPVIDMVMSTEPFGPGLRLYRDRKGHKGTSTMREMNTATVEWHYSQSTLSPVRLPSSRCQSPALPSSAHVSCCPPCGLCLALGLNVSGRPGSFGWACLRPATEKNSKCKFARCSFRPQLEDT